STVSCTALDPSGKLLAVATQNTLTIYNLGDLTVVFSVNLEKKIYNMNYFSTNLVTSTERNIVSYSNNGQLLYNQTLGDSTTTRAIIRKINDITALILLDREGNERLIQFNVNTKEVISSYDIGHEAHDIDVSANGKYIGINGKLGKNYMLELLLLNDYSKYYIYNSPQLYSINSLNFSHDSRYVAIANNSNDDHVHIIDVERKMPLGSVHLDVIQNIYHSIDGIDAVQFDRKSNSLFVSAVETMVNYQLQCIY
ncbi:MAG: hypothetical protein WBP41_14130, partial [Saprospiraceae bacterium]